MYHLASQLLVAGCELAKLIRVSLCSRSSWVWVLLFYPLPSHSSSFPLVYSCSDFFYQNLPPTPFLTSDNIPPVKSTLVTRHNFYLSLSHYSNTGSSVDLLYSCLSISLLLLLTHYSCTTASRSSLRQISQPPLCTSDEPHCYRS